MAYNPLNKLKMWKKVIEITNELYEDDCMTYAGFFRKHIEPVYPMTYQQYIKIINTPKIDVQIERLEKEKERREQAKKNNQLSIFDDENE